MFVTEYCNESGVTILQPSAKVYDDSISSEFDENRHTRGI